MKEGNNTMIRSFLKNNKFIYTLLCKCNDVIKIHDLIRRYKAKKAMRSYGSEIKKVPKKVILCGIPVHNNLGDQAQAVCELKWFKDNYPDHKVFCFSSDELMQYNSFMMKALEKSLKKTDLIFMQSGYNTTDIYLNEERMHRSAILNFRHNKIVFMPQTVLFKDEKEQNISVKIYAKHNNILFLARDDLSYNKAKKLFPKHRVELYPDIVTTLIGGMKFNAQRNKILICARNDKESIFTKDQINEISSYLGKYGQVDITDTSIDAPVSDIISCREKYVFSAIDSFSQYKVTVTDRYHGLIFSLIAGTPVVILPTSDHKLSSGINWFSSISEFRPYVHYCDDITKLESIVESVLKEELDHQFPDYFKQYYGSLKSIIEGDA